ncbi:MAG: hypothetical protein ACFE9S_04295 [Candidatus Hermodarchaeota archaeon]
MEDKVWERDTTPYILFRCERCRQYTYVKTIQKSKKCVRCGYTQKVSKIRNYGKVVKGISKVVELVKQKQNEIAIKELGSEPEFRTSGDFIIAGMPKRQDIIVNGYSDNEDYLERFKQMLSNISESYNSFPYYIIEIMAENYGIPHPEVKLLTRKLQKQGSLIRKDSEFFYKKKV